MKWIDVCVMSVYFYVLLWNFLEGFRKDQMRKFLKFGYDDKCFLQVL